MTTVPGSVDDGVAVVSVCPLAVGPDADGDGDALAAEPDDLRAVPLFQSLSDDNLCSLAGTVVKRRAAAGDVLCREGDHGEEMYVVLRGAVTLHKDVDGRETALGRLESGAYFGEMALIGDAPRSATIRASTDLEYLAIDRETLMAVIAVFPTVALQILRGYNERLADTTERLARLSAVRTAGGAAAAPAGTSNNRARANSRERKGRPSQTRAVPRHPSSPQDV